MKKVQHSLMSIRTLLTVLCSITLVCLFSCDKPAVESEDTTMAQKAEGVAIAESIDVVETVAPTGESEDSQDALDADTVADEVDSYAAQMAAYNAVGTLLSSETVLDQTTISNALAGVDTEEITRVLMNTRYAREQLTPHSYNYMHILEEVLRRGEPPWTRLVALYRLLDYYTFHSTKSDELMEKRHAFTDIARQLTPDDAPDETSMNTFITIHTALLQIYRGQDLLTHVDYVEKLAAQNVPFRKDQREYMLLSRAIGLIDTGRAAEARKIIREMHDNMDSLDWGTRREVADVDDFMDRMMTGWRNLYPEFCWRHPDYEQRHTFYQE